MRTRAIALIVTILVNAGSARADTLPTILNAPMMYTPGTPFSFELHAPGLIGFTSYTLTLQLQAGANPPPLTVSITPPPGLTDYPFASTSNFSVGQELSPVPIPATFQISDSSGGPPVQTIGGTDYLALVTVTPDASLTVPITVTITSATFNSFQPPGEPQSSLPIPVTINPNLSQTAAVPTPAAWTMLAVGGFGLVALRRRFDRAAA